MSSVERRYEKLGSNIVSDLRIGFVRETARAVLRRNRISKPPVRPEAIARVEGLEVHLVMTWPDDVSGLLLRESRRIGLNGRHARTRQRFSLAHELGHWFLRHDFPWHERTVTIDAPPEQMPEDEHQKLQESEANEFAGELLAPRNMLKQALGQTRDTEELAELFDMSSEALWIRILRHNLLK